MNHYLRAIGSMLILVYSMLTAFLFIDKVFVNIIYFQGMFYTQIFGIPVFLFLNILIILLCIIVGTVLAYKINQQNTWIKSQIERSIEGETVGINNQNLELYSETLEIYHTLVPLNQLVLNVKATLSSQVVNLEPFFLEQEFVDPVEVLTLIL